MTPINCEINLNLPWSSTCVITNSTGIETFATTDAKIYVPVVTLSTQDKAKILWQLNSGFKRTINWNKYLSKGSIERQEPYLDYLYDSNFQGVDTPYFFSFEDDANRTINARYFLPKFKQKYYNVMIYG